MIYSNAIQIPRPNFLGGGNWEVSGLKDITVVVGKNGSGKSLLLRAWRDQKPAEIHYIVPERTGELDFNPGYMTDEQDGVTRRGQSARNFNPDYRRRILGRLQTLFMKRGNVREGIAPGSPTDIEAMLHVLLPDFNVSLVGAGNPPYVIRRQGDAGIIGQVDQLSSGEVQLITMGLDALTIASIWEIESPASRVMLIDEPDAHIHPDLQARFADLITRIVDRYKVQVVVATHSMSLLTALTQFGGAKAATVFLSREKNNYKAEVPSAVTREIAACLGGHVLMGPLFGSPLLLVEGDDDYRIWGQVPRHHVVSVAVIPCSGSDEVKRYQAKLEQVFDALSEPHDVPIGFALLDGDKEVPQAHPSNLQRHVRFIKLECHESENLYLTDEVLRSLGHSWGSACEAIEDLEKVATPEKAAALALIRADRRHGDLKGLMDMLSHKLDAKNVPWTIRVSSVIGKARPSGTLEQYLGAQLVAALWPPINSPSDDASAPDGDGSLATAA
jgi:hypothetical protein